MTIALTETLETFAARRRKAQTDIEARIRDEVERSVDLHHNTRAWNELLDELKTVYAEQYQAETGVEIEPTLPRGAITQLRSTLRKITRHHKDPDQNSVNRITTWLATAILSMVSQEVAKADPEDVFLEWVHMDDEAVRPEHRSTGGQVRPVGEPFDVDGVPMRYPGDPRAPIDLWINCRCTLRPALASEVNESALSSGKSFADEKVDPPPSATLPEGNTSTVLVALPAQADDIHEAGEEPSHVTLLFLGEVDDDFATHLKDLAAEAAGYLEPFSADVAGHGTLGADGAKVLFIQAHEFNVARGSVEQDDQVASLLHAIDTFPQFIPHITVTYGQDAPPEITDFEQVTFDRLAVWHGDEQTEYPLGEAMPEQTDPQEEPENTEASFAISEKPWDGSPSRFTDEEYKRSCILHKCDGMEKSCHSLPIKEPNGDLSRAAVHSAAGRLNQVDADESAKSKAKSALRGAYRQLGEDPPEELSMHDESLTAAAETRVPWHGVMAPEGVMSGDKRGFKEGSLRHRDLPLPLTWQKQSAEAHDGNVTVATIENIDKVENEMRGGGNFLSTVEAAEVVDLIREFGRFGQSVDADDVTMELDEELEAVWFTDARISSSCIVPIPAFAEAWIALGTWADHDAGNCGCFAPQVPSEDVEDECKNRDPDTGDCLDEQVPYDEKATIDTPAQFVDIAPGRTEDGPGWLTHPVDTDRLRDYWVSGPGAAKIGWGTPGDFNRCRLNVAEYVKPQHLAGYCANRHYDALGRWPGRHGVAAETLDLENTETAEAISMTAAAAFRGTEAPASWFSKPEADGPTPLTVTDDGQVYGHLATWGTCHIGFDGQCVDPPESPSSYAYFMTGEVCLDNGERCAVGNISIGGGHAPGRLGARPALEHYDSTSAAIADVRASDGEHGIWLCGWIRPGSDPDMVTALRASALSGDWRKVGTRLDLVAALAVNVPGFGIPRAQVAASAEGQLSLVAAGVVPPRNEVGTATVNVDYDTIATKVVEQITAQNERREKMKALAARVNGE